MPFKSKAQRRFMYAAEARGEVPRGTAARWSAKTTDKKLPERLKKEADMKNTAFNVGVSLGLEKVAYDGRNNSVSVTEDTRIMTARELAAIKDPEERKRYLADMAATNHRLAMTTPPSVREAVATQRGSGTRPA